MESKMIIGVAIVVIFGICLVNGGVIPQFDFDVGGYEYPGNRGSLDSREYPGPDYEYTNMEFPDYMMGKMDKYEIRSYLGLCPQLDWSMCFFSEIQLLCEYEDQEPQYFKSSRDGGMCRGCMQCKTDGKEDGEGKASEENTGKDNVDGKELVNPEEGQKPHETQDSSETETHDPEEIQNPDETQNENAEETENLEETQNSEGTEVQNSEAIQNPEEAETHNSDETQDQEETETQNSEETQDPEETHNWENHEETEITNPNNEETEDNGHDDEVVDEVVNNNNEDKDGDDDNQATSDEERSTAAETEGDKSDEKTETESDNKDQTESGDTIESETNPTNPLNGEDDSVNLRNHDEIDKDGKKRFDIKTSSNSKSSHLPDLDQIKFPSFPGLAAAWVPDTASGLLVSDLDMNNGNTNDADQVNAERKAMMCPSLDCAEVERRLQCEETARVTQTMTVPLSTGNIQCPGCRKCRED